MSESQPRHAAPNPKASIKALRTLRFWAFPILATLALMSALAALYLGGILNPITNLRHYAFMAQATAADLDSFQILRVASVCFHD